MEQLSRRQYAILMQLIEYDGFLNSSQLSLVIGAAGKTIRRDIEQMSAHLKEVYGIDIESKSGLGFYLHREDKEKFQKFMEIYNNAYKEIYPYVNNEARLHYLIQRLIAANGYVKIASLSEEIYCSRSLITRTLHVVREVLEEYGLLLEQKANYGLIVNGKESNKRICMMNEHGSFLHMQGSVYEEKNYKQLFELPTHQTKVIRAVILDFLKQDANYCISSEAIDKIVLAIILLKNCNSSGQEVSYTDEEIINCHFTFSYEMSKKILAKLKEEIDLVYTEDDIAFLGIIMLGYRTILRYEEVHVKRQFHECLALAEDAIHYLSNRCGLATFETDRIFKERLTLHLIGLRLRAQNNLIIDYVPGYLTIKNSSLAIELSVLLCKRLSDTIGYKIHRNEVPYMAFLLLPVIMRMEKDVLKDNRVAVISYFGRDVAMSIVEATVQRFNRFIRDIKVYEQYQKNDIQFGQYDFIITDLPAEEFESTNTPVVHFDFKISKHDEIASALCYYRIEEKLAKLKKIFRKENFYTLKGVNSDVEALNRIADRLQEDLGIKGDIHSDLRIRNTLNPVENGNTIAYLKTLENYTSETYCSVFKLEHPVIFFREAIQCVIVLILGNDHKEDLLLFGGEFEHWINNGRAMMELLHNLTYENFISCLENYIRNFPEF